MSRSRGIAFFTSRKKRSAPVVPRPGVNVPRPAANPVAAHVEAAQIVRLARIEAKLDRLLVMETKLDNLMAVLMAAVEAPSEEQIEHELAREEAQPEEEQASADEQTEHDTAIAVSGDEP